jgi:hypothetical protein
VMENVWWSVGIRGNGGVGVFQRNWIVCSRLRSEHKRLNTLFWIACSEI